MPRLSSSTRAGGGRVCILHLWSAHLHVCAREMPHGLPRCEPASVIRAQEGNRPLAYHCGDVYAAPATQATGLQLFNSMMLFKVGLAICLSLSARRSARLGRVRCCRSSLVDSVIPHLSCPCRNLINCAMASGGCFWFLSKKYMQTMTVWSSLRNAPARWKGAHSLASHTHHRDVQRPHEHSRCSATCSHLSHPPTVAHSPDSPEMLS